ncbi:MAG: hypothetical protein JRH15_14070 [Deltaproteobacteria bacterium]|nr:hypothetical protein [Deltaproteobacteria bacterium]
MTSLQAIVLLACIFGLAEIIAVKSKARLSSFFVIAILLLLAFWAGMPGDIWVTSNMLAMGATVAGLLLTSLGTLIDFDEFVQQWKTVVIGFGAVVLIVLFITVIGPFVIDRTMAVAASPVVAGGAVAQIIVGQILKQKGLLDAEIFCLLVLVLQCLIGVPISSILLRNEARRYIKSGDYETASDSETPSQDKTPKKTLIPQLPEAYRKPFILIAKTGLVTLLAYYLSGLTGGKANALLLCLILGVVFKALGFLESDVLGKANSFGITMFFVYALVFANIAKVTPGMLAAMIGPLMVVFLLGLTGIIAAGVIFSKLLKVNSRMGIVIGLTALYGFPATYYLAMEVAEAVGENQAQVTALRNYMLPQMLTAGFATVTIASVVIVGFVVNMI